MDNTDQLLNPSFLSSLPTLLTNNNNIDQLALPPSTPSSSNIFSSLQDITSIPTTTITSPPNNIIPTLCQVPKTTQLPAATPEKSQVYLITHNSCSIYAIHREEKKWFFIQKHLGLAFFNNINTFNSICWNNKIIKIAATGNELKIIRENDATEQGLKKSTLLSLETFEQLCKTIKKPQLYEILLNLINSIVCFF